jgi:hypothetical protein
MALPESKSKVLESTDEALLAGGDEAVVVGEGEEFVDLDKIQTEKEEKPAAAAAPEKKPAAAAAPAPVEDEIPDDLKGKTPAQLAKMYREAQSVIGRQGSELGDLRKRTDLAIMTSLEAIRARKAEQPAPAKAAAEPAPELDESEFFAKPTAAIDKAIENHPLIKKINETLGRTAADTQASRAQAAKEQFDRAHPDAAEILGDQEFREWVGKSKVRQHLLQRAHSSFDFDAGDEVFGTWKALKGVKTAAAKPADAPAADATPGAPTEAEVKAAASTLARAKGVKQAATAAAAQAAAVPTGGASAGKDAGAKKIYRRADILRLMETDPDRYEALADEIGKAYAENRVR